MNQGRYSRKDGEVGPYLGVSDFILKTIERHWCYIYWEVTQYVLCFNKIPLIESLKNRKKKTQLKTVRLETGRSDEDSFKK